MEKDSVTACVDINECVDIGRSVLCHEEANCVNVDGSHRCTCLNGRLGDGVVSCIDPDDVETQSGALVEIHMNGACSDFVAEEFAANLATFLEISPKRVAVARIRCASVHARIALLEPQEVTEAELKENDRVAAADLAATLTEKLSAEEPSWFAIQYQVTGIDYDDAVADVVVDKTKQQAWVPTPQVDAAGAGLSTADGGGSSTDAGLIVVIVLVLLILLVLVGVAARRRVADARQRSSMEEAGGTYLAPTGLSTSSRTTGTLATLRKSKVSSSAGYDEAPRSGKGDAARAPDSFLEGKVLIPSDELVREAKIGEGAFGLVFKGTWGEKAVAIKEVKGASVEAIKQLVDEGDRLSQIPPHANVVTFFGVCAEPMGVVLQFCAKGALLDKLYGADEDKFYQFSLAELQSLVLGIAAGLKHLHSVQVIHRDVATRNVLIDESGAPKLTDFGMSRDQEDGAEYVQQTKTSTGPLKWMAPEQMVDRIVSSKADMYSFGIVLWEMYARSEPWPGVMALQAAGNVMAGKQHAIAKEATPMAAAIMLACLDNNPHARPSAARVVKGGAAVWGADGAKVDGEAVGAEAKTNADVLKLKDTHFAELPKEEDDAVYLAPPVKGKAAPADDGYGAPPKSGGVAGLTLERRSSSRRHGKGAKTPRSRSTSPTNV
jgi:proto-oncogene tyrosine-protein kinase Ret